MNEKIFVLGVGAQKAGTSWIHNYLNSMPSSDFGILKEYHIFDAIYLDSSRGFYERAEKNVLQYLKSKNQRPSKDHKQHVMKLAFLHDLNLYYSYFDDLLKNENKSITGDITPSYATLPVQVLQNIKNEFNQRGIRVVPVFIMREPVARLQSMARMWLRRNSPEAKPSLEQEIDVIRKQHLNTVDIERSNYTKTLTNLTAVFGSDCYVGFYENMFVEDEMRKLCELLNTQYIKPELDKWVNVSRTSNELPRSITDQLREGYKPIYDDCKRRFGDDLISNLWGVDANRA